MTGVQTCALPISELAATSLDDGKVTPLGVAGVIPLGVIDGGLTYLNADGVIMAVPFDVGSRRTTGAPIPVQDSVRMKGGGGSDHSEAAMTHAGGLVYLRGIVDRRLVWVDRRGVRYCTRSIARTARSQPSTSRRTGSSSRSRVRRSQPASPEEGLPGWSA